MKKILCLVLALAVMLTAALAVADTSYTATVDSQIGGVDAVTCTVTLADDGSIVAVTVDQCNDTPGICDAAVKSIPEQMVAQNSINVDAVAGAGQNAGLAAGGHQQVVIGGIVVLVAIVHLHGAHGGGQHRQAQLQTEKVKGRVGRAIFADGVHLHADFLPLLIVALEGHAQSFGAGAGDGVAAGHAVAHGAGLAVGTHTGAGCL